MVFFKCKMCGGTVEFEQGATVGVCDSCGTKQTLPRLDDDKKANLYDRANHFRRNNEYDKAMGIYEQILAEDNTDAEAYWSLVLCRYGIEYVEDPATHKRVPTVNRAQYMSVSADEDYKSALKYADAYQRAIYEQEAKTIDEIQKGILEISSKEEPFDIFISYKETDESGRRTPDSVLANDLYHQLTNEGFKVFFSRITLEDKLGTAYEPYIFSALNSAKVMVVIGTKPEYFNAVWVKNEWSRYLALVKKSDGKKMLIPAYRDMDPYDLPEEFSHLQAQDMSKLGFMQDLIRGIKKIVQADEPKPVVKETVVVNGGSANVAPLLKRVFMFLEDSNWEEADEYCEKVLDQDPENAQAYLGKLMAELEVRKPEQLADCEKPFDENSNYQKILRFGSEELKNTITGYVDYINKRNEYDRQEAIYNRAEELIRKDRKCYYADAVEILKEIPNWKDAKEQIEICNKRIVEITEQEERERKEKIYNNAVALMNRDNPVAYSEAINEFVKIRGWKDADKQIQFCQQRITEIRANEQAKAEAKRIAAKKAKRKRTMTIIFFILSICAIVAFTVFYENVIIPNRKYNAAMELFEAGKYSEAASAFEAMDGYKDSAEKIKTIEKKIKDIEQKNNENLFITQKNSLADITVSNTVRFGSYEQDNNTGNGKEEIEWEVLAVENKKALLISKYALDCQEYNSEAKGVTWESCTLRNWLNDTFLNQAFSPYHQEEILSSTVTADKNPSYNTAPGNATTDKVFLLSINEAEKYFSTDEERKCVPSEYTKANGAYTSSLYTKGGAVTCWWWLRSPGDGQDYAAAAYGDGSVISYGYNVDDADVCVRPAMWVSID